MKKQFKRVLCTVLTVALLASTAVTAFAAGGDKFTDVKADSWYKPYVDFVVEHNYFKGTSDTTFSPLDSMTRAMFVTVIARMENVQLNDNATTTFSDVSSGTWYTGAVAWAADKNIINGTGNGQFAPAQSITRQEMAVIMQRYVEYVQSHSNKTHKTPNPDITFVDADQIASWATAAVKQCVYWGLIIGNEKGEFMPTKNATRAEVSAVIYRLAWLIMGGGGGGGGGGSVTDTYKLTVEVSAVDSKGVAVGASPYTDTVTIIDTNHTKTVKNAIEEAYNYFNYDGTSNTSPKLFNGMDKLIEKYKDHYATSNQADVVKNLQNVMARYERTTPEGGVKYQADQLAATFGSGIDSIYTVVKPTDFIDATTGAWVGGDAQTIYANQGAAVKDAIIAIVDQKADGDSAYTALNNASAALSKASTKFAPSKASVTAVFNALKDNGSSTTLYNFYNAVSTQDATGTYTLVDGTIGANFLNSLNFHSGDTVSVKVTFTKG